jgi:hypothetical protein
MPKIRLTWGLEPLSEFSMHDKNLLFLLFVLWVRMDLGFHIEAEFDFSNFFSLSLAPGINWNFITYIFFISC